MKRDPLSAERLGMRIGSLAYRLDKKHRNRTLANLAIAFPEWTDEKRESVAKDVFRHFGIVAADFLRSPGRSQEEVLASVTVEGVEHYERAHEAGKGVIAVTAHMGNWERFSHWLTSTGRSISVVARDVDDSAMNGLIGKIRETAGIEVLSRGNSARAILTKLRQNEIIGLLPDQNSDETFVPFFGHSAGTVLGPAVLHLRTKAPILPTFCIRIAPATYLVKVFPPILGEDHNGDANELMAAYNQTLEHIVRDYPEQYLWMHDRWKSARQKGIF